MSKGTVQKLLSKGDIRIDGDRPWDIQVLDERFYNRLLAQGSLGAGESYMEGWWECKKIDELICKAIRAKIDRQLFSWQFLLDTLKAILYNQQGKWQAFYNAQQHYDIGDDLYEKMLDRRMMYSCGYWKSAKNLDEAQENKLELSCQKLDLKPGMQILDIGCGWGGFAKFAAEKYKVKVVGITVSKNQCHRAKKICAGLPVEIRLQDYRDLKGKFDRIVSIGMFEHVGCKNYPQYMQIVHRCLKEDGLFLLHTIGGNISQNSIDPWAQKYIFPHAMLPSVRQIGDAIEGRFMMEDWHSFGPYYDKTLLAWFANFDRHWHQLRSKYGDRFYRMWKYYLLSCAGTFRARDIQVWQILLSKNGLAIPRLR
jgi:cyclopropane-fatty-acyl-phospholipid synthase